MNENFLQRWARRKAEYKNGDARPEGDGHGTAQASDPDSADLMPEKDAAPLPTLEDVAQLNGDSDYSRFVSARIDKTVRRAALKKLFSDPHFNVMDGLDIYIDDYNKPSPVSAAMLAALKHTQPLFEAVAQEEARHAEPQPSAIPEGGGDELEEAEVQAKPVEHEAESVQPDEWSESQADETGPEVAHHPVTHDKDDGVQAAQGRS